MIKLFEMVFLPICFTVLLWDAVERIAYLIKDLYILRSAKQRDEADGDLCICKLPGLDANDPSKCPTCGKLHRH